MRNRVRLLLAVSLLSVGVWQLGGVGWIQAKAWLSRVLIEDAWDRVRKGEARAKPWPWADTWPLVKLRVERLDLERYVLAGSSGRVLAFGPGHLSGTAAPGAQGNSVISGHRDTHFRFLRDLREGDRISVMRPDGRSLRYAVQRRAIQHRDEVWLLAPSHHRLLTLVTCYPFDALTPNTAQRYVVTAAEVAM